MSIFGNRDVGSPLEAGKEELAPVDDVPDDASPIFSVDVRRVVLRISGDESILVGRAEGREPAVEIARGMVRHIEAASSRGEWPQIDERFVRPGAIVSVDVQRGE